MRIDKIEIRPVTNSINPEFSLSIRCFLERNCEIPLEISGHIFSEDKKKLADIHQILQFENQQIVLAAREDRFNKEFDTNFMLTAQLNHRTLDHIETLRTSNSKGDVILNVEIFVKLLRSKIILSNMILSKENSNGLQSVSYKYDPKFTTSQSNMWVLSGNCGPDFIYTENKKYSNLVTIPSSDWVHDYCPVFQIGRFTVFEYLLPEYTEGKDSIEERLNKSINAIKKMEANILEGEWNEVIEASRPIWEVLRNHDEIKDLLMEDGYTDQAFEAFNGTLKQLFSFSSNFIHQEEAGSKKLMPEMKASKEDAYLIYALSLNFVNLISKKMQRLHY
jgi:hypothetical protein